MVLLHFPVAAFMGKELGVELGAVLCREQLVRWYRVPALAAGAGFPCAAAIGKYREKAAWNGKRNLRPVRAAAWWCGAGRRDARRCSKKWRLVASAALRTPGSIASLLTPTASSILMAIASLPSRWRLTSRVCAGLWSTAHIRRATGR